MPALKVEMPEAVIPSLSSLEPDSFAFDSILEF